jgi:uronate dehydrogenase
MKRAEQPILFTGAAGKLGREVTTRLAARGFRLRMTDIAPYPLDVPGGCEHVRADINDGVTLLRLAEGCAGIVHFAGLVEYGSFEAVLGPNLRGAYHVFEAARRESIRVVNASSNHVIGYHERGTRLGKDCSYRPDSFYGISKVFGEMVARMYWDKHGVESVSLRIGSCFEQPKEERMLATWLSRDDLARLVECSLLAPRTGCAIVWGASNNTGAWWQEDDRDLIGWRPQDSADPWMGSFPGPGTRVADRFQGGRFCEVDYSRKG